MYNQSIQKNNELKKHSPSNILIIYFTYYTILFVFSVRINVFIIYTRYLYLETYLFLFLCFNAMNKFLQYFYNTQT